MSGGQSKTEDASPHKLRKAKEKGQISKSVDLNAYVGLVAVLCVIVFLMPDVVRGLFQIVSEFLMIAPYFNIKNYDILIVTGMKLFFMVIGPVLFLTLIVGVMINLMQAKGVFSTHPLTPDLKKLNPIAGFKKIFSIKLVIEFIKNVLRLCVIAAVAWYVYKADIAVIPHGFPSDIALAFDTLYTVVVKTMLLFMLAMLPFTVIDFLVQRWLFLKEMRMSKQDVKDEHKNQDGDPALKSKRKQLNNELREKANSLASVASSDIVVTNPTFLAVALKFDQKTMSAPIVTSKGKGIVAKYIRQVARDNNVMLRPNKPLARKIYKNTQINAEIGPDLYDEIAELYREFYRR